MSQDPVVADNPTPLRPRHDGWTAARQRCFLDALAESGCISHACHASGMTPRSAYRLRAHPAGAAFALAWNQALQLALPRLTTLAFERAIRGSIREKWADGRLVAETRQPSDQLLMFLLQRLSVPAPSGTAPLSQVDTAAADAARDYRETIDRIVDADVRADRLNHLDYDAIPIEQGRDPSPPPLFDHLHHD